MSQTVLHGSTESGEGPQPRQQVRHTPAPWSAVFVDDPRGQPVPYYRGLICIVADGDERISVVSDRGHASPGEWVANARLIAAAPELLEALRYCLREHGGFTIKGECERQALAAISKAVGDAKLSSTLGQGETAEGGGITSNNTPDTPP